MDANQSSRVFIYSDGQGSFAAATHESPYFCFEGTSEAAVLEEAKRALAFYGTVKTKPAQAARPAVSLKRYTRVREAELAFA